MIFSLLVSSISRGLTAATFVPGAFLVDDGKIELGSAGAFGFPVFPC